jgi:hypothetical protein
VPSLTEPLISKTPFIGLGVAGSLLGVNWIIRRRMTVEALADGTDRSETTDTPEENGREGEEA